LVLCDEGEDKAAELAARAALARPGDTRFAAAVLAEVLLRRGEHDEALEVLASARRRWPGVAWYDITLADALLEADRAAEAEVVLEGSLRRVELRRHALKRLSRLALDRGDPARGRRFLEDLVALAPDYLVYASDYLTLGRLQLADGDTVAARTTWARGAEIYPRHAEMRALLMEHFGMMANHRPRIDAVAEEALGVRRIPVKTPMITRRTGLLEVIEQATAGIRLPGDVVALSESAVAAGQGRMLPLELMRPGPLAGFLCRFVGKLGPLHSPQGMQGAIMEVGAWRVASAALAGGLGKALGHKGWFYKVAGPPTAMIDDVAACLPPHDHHVVFGPGQPDRLAADLAIALRCHLAIVDANHRSGAWVVGASSGVDRKWLMRVLADNPAGNEDEQTPVVIVRRIPG